MKCLNKRNNNNAEQAPKNTSTEKVNKMVKNVSNILSELEESLSKSHDYERHLFNGKHCCKKNKENCKSCCDDANICNSEAFDDLQRRHDDLSEKYTKLLRSHASRCEDLEEMTKSLNELKVTFETVFKELARANGVIREIGVKYLMLKKSKGKDSSESLRKQIANLRRTKRHLLKELVNSKRMIDDFISRKLAGEGNAVKAQLLLEIKRSSHLQQENLKLKRELNEALGENKSTESL